MYSNLTADKILNLVVDEVNKQRNHFVSIYKDEPRYVKFLMWLVNRLMELDTSYINDDIQVIRTFHGLQVCITPAITKITEIEVF